jgi:hypothetical protein
MAIIRGLLSVSHTQRPKKQLLYDDAVLCELRTEVKEPFENRVSRMIDGTSVAKTPRNLLVCVKVLVFFFYELFTDLTPIYKEKANALGVFRTAADISKLVSSVVL